MASLRAAADDYDSDLNYRGEAKSASVGGKTAEAEDDDSDVEFVHNEENIENGGNALLNSPARAGGGGGTARVGGGIDGGGRRTGLGLLKDDRLYDDDDDGNNIAGGNTGGGKKKSAEEDSDDELEIVGTKGVDALIDFPHSRENCLTHRFGGAGAESNKAHCANCYCYVCDVPAKDCASWPTHCQATHGERRWREERERSKRLGVDAASDAASTQQQQPAAAAGPARSNNAHANRPDLPQYSIQALLEKLTVVHPVEATPPPTCITTLRHYQKQSLGTIYCDFYALLSTYNRCAFTSHRSFLILLS